MLALHAEAVPGDARTVRWVLADGPALPLGPVASAPGDLGTLLADGTLESAVTVPGAIVLTARTPETWRSAGAAIREALQDSLPRAGWQIGAPAELSTRLRAAVDQALAGPVGDLVRSHGGTITIAGITDGVIDVELSGTCHGCPAAEITLGGRLEAAVRAIEPDLVGIRQVLPIRRRLA